jgi:hypothetical protein
VSQITFLVSIVCGAITVYACQFGELDGPDFITLPSTILTVLSAAAGVWLKRMGL